MAKFIIGVLEWEVPEHCLIYWASLIEVFGLGQTTPEGGYCR